MADGVIALQVRIDRAALQPVGHFVVADWQPARISEVTSSSATLHPKDEVSPTYFQQGAGFEGRDFWLASGPERGLGGKDRRCRPRICEWGAPLFRFMVERGSVSHEDLQKRESTLLHPTSNKRTNDHPWGWVLCRQAREKSGPVHRA